MTAQELHQSAAECFHKGQYDQAAQLFAAALVVQPTAEFWNDWATAQAASGHYADALKGFKAALQLEPKFAAAIENLALLWAKPEFDADTTNGFLADLRPATRSELAAVLHAQGVSHFRGKALDEAARCLRRAVASAEGSMQWNDLGTVLIGLQDMAGAETAYRTSLQLDAANQLAAANLLVLLEQQGRTEEAAALESRVRSQAFSRPG